MELTLEAGDELVVPENLTKIVGWGVVTRPQVYPLQDGEVTTLADAIAQAGGQKARARDACLLLSLAIEQDQLFKNVLVQEQLR